MYESPCRISSWHVIKSNSRLDGCHEKLIMEWKMRTALSSAAEMSHIQIVHGASSSLVASSVEEASNEAIEQPGLASVVLPSEGIPGGDTACAARRKLYSAWPSGDDPCCSCHTWLLVSDGVDWRRCKGLTCKVSRGSIVVGCVSVMPRLHDSVRRTAIFRLWSPTTHSSEFGLDWHILIPGCKPASSSDDRLAAEMVRKCSPSGV